MNQNHLYAASRDYIFIFCMSQMKQLAKIKVGNHFLRIAMSPNFLSDGSAPLIAYTNQLDNGLLTL